MSHNQNTNNALPADPAINCDTDSRISDRRMLLAGAGVLGAAAIAKLAKAGPLTPPQGPPSSTGVTLSQISSKLTKADAGIVEPRTPVNGLPGDAEAVCVISQPGSYYLTGDITVPPNMVGIDIRVPGVHLHGNGFSISSSTDNAAAGIRCVNGQHIKEAKLTGRFSVGVSCVDPVDAGTVLEDIRCLPSSSSGQGCDIAFKTGHVTLIKRCDAVSAGTGFQRAYVQSTPATGQFGHGVCIECTATRCSAGFTGTGGFHRCQASSCATGFAAACLVSGGGPGGGPRVTMWA